MYTEWRIYKILLFHIFINAPLMFWRRFFLVNNEICPCMLSIMNYNKLYIPIYPGNELQEMLYNL